MQDPRTHAIIGAALHIHDRLGPGLLETAYRRILVHELRRCGHTVEEEVWVDLTWAGDLVVPRAYRLDLVVDHTVVVEVKATRGTHPVCVRQMLTYLELTGLPVGLLLNFGERRLRDGIRRFVR